MMATRSSNFATILTGATVLVVGAVGAAIVSGWLFGEKKKDRQNPSQQTTNKEAHPSIRQRHKSSSASSPPASVSTSMPPLPPLHMTPSDLQKAIEDSRDKLDETAITLRPYCTPEDVLHTEPATALTQLRGYRCRFTLQIILPETGSATSIQYGVRNNGQVLPLEMSSYEFANPGLRRAMSALLQEWNSFTSHYGTILSHANISVATATFASSWDGQQRWVTFHYQHQQKQSQSTSNATLSENMNAIQEEWMAQAQQIQKRCGFEAVRGRSKGRLWQVVFSTDSKKIDTKNPPPSEDDLGLTDTLLLYPPSKTNSSWTVASHGALLDPSLSSPAGTNINNALSFQLFKPEGAFCHPNAQVMCRALGWILTRIQTIRDRTKCKNDDSRNSPTLLELYCGCGAHTIPIARSGLVSKIMAVEYDQRLVQACGHNIQSNHSHDIIQIISQDANLWAKRHQQKRTHAMQNDTTSFQVLLVDPPRQGLHPHVVEMARGDPAICDIIYISCGKEALVRDLDLLVRDYRVADCAVTDLFPGTSSVESLVHLTRRRHE